MELVTCCNLVLSYQEISTCQGKEYFMPVIYFMVNFHHFVKNILEKAYFVTKFSFRRIFFFLQKNDLNFHQNLPQLPTLWKAAQDFSPFIF
jgi:hypothetical protein